MDGASLSRLGLVVHPRRGLNKALATLRRWSDDMIGRRGRYADLTLIGPDLASDRDLKTMALKGSLYESEVPVLLVPSAADATLAPRCVLVAWDSGPEAARAVREALPLLAGADEVHVTMVDPRASEDDGGPEPGTDLAAYLARHGAKVTVDRLPRIGQSIADTLRIHAVDIAADMIVMGAYGHSRIRAMIIGSTTTEMIRSCLIPILLFR
jgi:nucleotide-binding universal stress UspA family protein